MVRRCTARILYGQQLHSQCTALVGMISTCKRTCALSLTHGAYVVSECVFAAMDQSACTYMPSRLSDFAPRQPAGPPAVAHTAGQLWVARAVLHFWCGGRTAIGAVVNSGT